MASRGDCSGTEAGVAEGDEEEAVVGGGGVCDVDEDLVEERTEGLRGISSNVSSSPLLTLSGPPLLSSFSSSLSSWSSSISLISSSGTGGVGRGSEEARAILCIISDVHPSKPSEKEPKDSVSSEDEEVSSAMLCLWGATLTRMRC